WSASAQSCLKLPKGTRYSVAAILSLALVAVLANHTSVLAIAEWATRQTRHVRRALGFRRDTTPHQTTIQRLLARLDPADLAAAVQRVFDPCVPGELRERGSQGVALDGKAQLSCPPRSSQVGMWRCDRFRCDV